MAQSPLTIRECRVSDYERIHEINKNDLGYDYPPESTKARLESILSRPADKIFVACDGGFVAGYLHAADYECTYAPPLKNIMSFAIDASYRGKGVGRALLQAAESWARESGCEGVRVVSRESRGPAHAFYMHCGYELRKTQKNFIKPLKQHVSE